MYFYNFYFKLIEGKGGLPFKVLRLLLCPLSYLYLVAIKVIRKVKSTRRDKFQIPIISVGNITWGGTGKTPVVLEIAKYLRENYKRVAIVYHGGYHKDEVKLFNRNLSNALVFQGKDRRSLIRRIMERDLADVVILDDGFQQWGIGKDLELLCLNYREPLGNGFLIPRGNLREEPQSIKRADLILINKATDLDRKEEVYSLVRRYNENAPIILSRFSPIEVRQLLDNIKVEFDKLKSLPSAILTAVADPISFRDLLLELEVKLVQEFIYPDHYEYKEEDLYKIKGKVKDGVRAIFFTEKDYVKIERFLNRWRQIFPSQLPYVVKIKVEFLENEETLFRRLDLLLDRPGI